MRRFLQHGASSPPRPPYGHLETLICAVHACVCVFVCLAGHEQCADDVKSPWVAFRRSPARSGNHPVYGPYVKTAQRRAHASSEDVTHTHTHTFAIFLMVSNETEDYFSFSASMKEGPENI